MRSILFPCLLLVGAVSAHAQSTTTFRLPPDPDATSRPQAQGPVDLEGDTRTAPRVITSPTPRPSASPTEQPSPRATSTPTPRPTPQPTRSAEAGPNLPSTNRSVPTRDVLANDRAATTTAVQADESDTQPAPEASPDETTQFDDPTQSLPPADFQSDSVASEEATQEPDLTPAFGFDWRWAAAGIAGLLALVAILFVLLRRRSRGRADKAELLELPATPLRSAEDHSPPPNPAAGSLEVEAFAMTLSRSVMNATISYRVSLYNRGREPVSMIRISGDVTTAHGRVPPEQQLADAAQAFPELHTFESLDPGQRATIRGDLRLPLREVRALRQGNVPVFVPLLRLIVRADNMEPQAHTYVIGAKPAQKGARPNPFRLDEPPRSYAQLSTRAVA